jgi:hypothetical protein
MTVEQLGRHKIRGTRRLLFWQFLDLRHTSDTQINEPQTIIVRENDVAGFDVAMYDAEPMEGCDSARQLDRNCDRFIERHSSSCDAFFERLARVERHGYVQAALPAFRQSQRAADKGTFDPAP